MSSSEIVSYEEQQRLAKFKAELTDAISFSSNEEGFVRFLYRIRRLLDNEESREYRRSLLENKK